MLSTFFSRPKTPTRFEWAPLAALAAQAPVARVAAVGGIASALTVFNLVAPGFSFEQVGVYVPSPHHMMSPPPLTLLKISRTF